MRVNALTLTSIAKKMLELEKLDIQVNEFEHYGQICTVESTDSQQDGRTYYHTDVNEKSA